MQLIESYIKQHTGFLGDLSLYNELIRNARANLDLSPDISIECSKALIEAVSKILIKHVMGENFREKDFNKVDSHKLVQKALEDALGDIGDFESDFVRRVVSVVHHVAEIRNERCEVAHGRALPKEVASSREFAFLILNVSDALTFYMLQSLEKIERNKPSALMYDDNPAFNDALDAQYPLEGKLLYSKALYEQDFLVYEELLEEYLSAID